MKISRRMAFCGITCGIAIFTMILSVFPYASVGLAAIAGITLVPPALEIKTRYGWLCYAAASLLALLVVPDASVRWMFVFFFGYYPLLQLRINLWYNHTWAWIVKICIFNAACITGVIFTVFVLGNVDMQVFLSDHPIVILAFPILNGIFIIYDVVLWRIIGFYRVRIHPFVTRFLR